MVPSVLGEVEELPLTSFLYVLYLLNAELLSSCSRINLPQGTSKPNHHESENSLEMLAFSYSTRVLLFPFFFAIY